MKKERQGQLALRRKLQRTSVASRNRTALGVSSPPRGRVIDTPQRVSRVPEEAPPRGGNSGSATSPDRRGHRSITSLQVRGSLSDPPSSAAKSPGKPVWSLTLFTASSASSAVPRRLALLVYLLPACLSVCLLPQIRETYTRHFAHQT